MNVLQFKGECYIGSRSKVKLVVLRTDSSLNVLERFIKKDGGMLIGYFEDGLLNGRGVYILPNGAFYEGNFQKGKI